MKKNIYNIYINKQWAMFALIAITALCVLLEPAHAQAWAQKVDSAGQQIVTGLKLIGRTVATVVGLWGSLMMISGRKRFSDLWEWFVGAAVFLAVTELVNLFFG